MTVSIWSGSCPGEKPVVACAGCECSIDAARPGAGRESLQWRADHGAGNIRDEVTVRNSVNNIK